MSTHMVHSSKERTICNQKSFKYNFFEDLWLSKLAWNALCTLLLVRTNLFKLNCNNPLGLFTSLPNFFLFFFSQWDQLSFKKHGWSFLLKGTSACPIWVWTHIWDTLRIHKTKVFQLFFLIIWQKIQNFMPNIHKTVKITMQHKFGNFFTKLKVYVYLLSLLKLSQHAV